MPVQQAQEESKDVLFHAKPVIKASESPKSARQLRAALDRIVSKREPKVKFRSPPRKDKLEHVIET